ncbi:MAG: MXAN_6230/SCO0854 family RING domain-containing protein [Kofleriaceae bacterium]
MHAIRTLLLARTHIVVMDPDQVADAATRPMTDSDLEKFEDELAQLGFVMSLDLAMSIRRLPNQAIQELRNWMFDTLAKTVGAHRPHVPLFRAFPAGTPANTKTLLLRRMLTWLLTDPGQPCPWCGEIKHVSALDPCGHLVCRTCWEGGTYSGCPICHRRVALTEPFVQPAGASAPERVQKSDGRLRLVHLAFDLGAMAKERFGRLVARTTPLSPDDRAEVETMIDALGPAAASWMPDRIAVRETMAICVARLWMISPDRHAIVRATAKHLRTATDVLRVAVVLMGGAPGLDEPIAGGKLGPIGRGLRRCVIEALDAIDPEKLVDDVRKHRTVWRRVGERLHPYEHAKRFPNAALAFAVVRGTKVSTATFGKTLVAQAGQLGRARIEDDELRITAWAGVVEDALRAGDVRGAIERLSARPGDVLRRADHLVRLAQAKQPEAVTQVVRAIQTAAVKGTPATLLTLGAHVAKRGAPWPRRVFLPMGEVLKAWSTPDTRAPLPADAIGAIAGVVRETLVARAEGRRMFPRGVIDRGLVDLLVPIGERSAARSKVAWPRGSEARVPDGEKLRLFLHWEEPAQTRVDLDLSIALYDESWRHVGTCDYTNLRIGDAAIHSGDLTSAPPPLGASELVDLDLAQLAKLGARYLVMVVFSFNSVAFEKLPFGFAGLMVSPAEGVHFDPRAVTQRFDLVGRSVIVVPLTIDLAARRLRWIDAHVTSQSQFNAVGGKRVALAHLGKDFENLVGTGARPTLWDVAAIHAAARANVIYVRERDGTFTQYRRRERESSVLRLARLHASEHDGAHSQLAPTTAPTWFALLTDDIVIPKGSEGYVLDARKAGADGVTRLAAADLVAHLAAK